MNIALVKNEEVKNVAVFDEIPETWEDFELVEVDSLDIKPSRGWSYVAGVFAPPPVDELAEWEKSIAASDKDLPRWAEDLFDLVTGAKTLAQLPELAQKVADKKAIRGAKP